MSAEADTDDEEVEDIGSNGCCVPEDEMLIVRDLNFDYPWKAGNQYCRVCPECDGRTFTSRNYFEAMRSANGKATWVIPKNEATPVPLQTCPYDDCNGDLIGTPDACPECEQPLVWEQPDADAGGDDESDGGEPTDGSDDDSDNE